MTMKPNASICEAGKKYYLRDPSLANTDIALHLTGSYLVTAGEDMGNEVQPPGTFWSERRLVAVRTKNDEIVVLSPFRSSLGQKMLAIGDFVTADIN